MNSISICCVCLLCGRVHCCCCCCGRRTVTKPFANEITQLEILMNFHTRTHNNHIKSVLLLLFHLLADIGTPHESSAQFWLCSVLWTITPIAATATTKIASFAFYLIMTTIIHYLLWFFFYSFLSAFAISFSFSKFVVQTFYHIIRLRDERTADKKNCSKTLIEL